MLEFCSKSVRDFENIGIYYARPSKRLTINATENRSNPPILRISFFPPPLSLPSSSMWNDLAFFWRLNFSLVHFAFWPVDWPPYDGVAVCVVAAAGFLLGAVIRNGQFLTIMLEGCKSSCGSLFHFNANLVVWTARCLGGQINHNRRLNSCNEILEFSRVVTAVGPVQSPVHSLSLPHHLLL